MKKRTSTIIIVIFVLFILNNTNNIYAQETSIKDLYNMSIEELMNVIVTTSSKHEENILESPSVINVITEEEIDFMNFTSLEQVLEYAVGISSINGEGNVFKTSTIRGNTLVNYNTNTLLLFDGIPMYNAYHGSFDLSMIPLASISRVEIVKGANSVLYGTNAICAVINIISKSYSEKSNNVKSKVQYGSTRSIYAAGSFTKTYNEYEVDIFFDTKATEGEELSWVDEKGNSTTLHKTLKNNAVVAKLKYKNLLKFHMQYYNRQLPNYRTRGFDVVDVVNGDSLTGIYAPQRNDEYGIILNTDINHSFNDNFSLHARGHYYDWLLKKIYVNKYWDYTSSLYSGDLELTYSPSKKSTNIMGLSYNNLKARRYKSEKDAYDIGKDDESSTGFSLYLNGNYQIIEKLNLFYGGRYYKSSYQDFSASNFSSRGAVTFQVNPKWYLKALYGKSFRVPTYFEKEVSSSKVQGNPNLEPEKSASYDFVVSGIIQGVRLNVDLFYMEIDDKITRVTYEPDPSKKQNQNIGKVSFKGIEIETKFRFSEKAIGFMGFSFIKGVNEKENEDLKFTYEKMLNFGMAFKPKERISIDPTLKYLDQWGRNKC